jgi:hypothetical protein
MKVLSQPVNVVGITMLITENGTDDVTLHTDLPPTFPPCVTTHNMAARFSVTKGRGLEYVKQHFPGMRVRVIDHEKGTTTEVVP